MVKLKKTLLFGVFAASLLLPTGQSARAASLPQAAGPSPSAPLQAPGPTGQPGIEEPPALSRREKEIAESFPRRGVLSPQGSITLEPSFEFAHSSVNRVALEGVTIIPSITIGSIDVKQVSRNSLIAALAFRAGLTDRLEFGIKIPYVWRSDSTTARPIEISLSEDRILDEEGAGFGDIELSLRHQLNDGGDWPYMVGGLRLKTDSGDGPFSTDRDPDTGRQRELPTGSGFWALEPSLTVIVPSDPAVLYANLSYLFNFSSNVEGFGDIDPGDSIGFGFGMGFAVNRKTSFNMGYDHSIVQKSTLNGRTIAGAQTTHIGSLVLGTSHRTESRRTLSLSLSAGMTENAPDVRILIRMPLGIQ